MKNLLLLLCSFGILFQMNTNAQNSGWTLGGQYFKFPNSQLSSLPNYTSNNPVKNASNIQFNANGNILFYILDGNIFDKDGDNIGNLSNFYAANQPGNNICMSESNTSEIVIIPDPNNCSRFYIITSHSTLHSCNIPNVSPMAVFAEPFVAILDFNLPRPNNNGKFGTISYIKLLQELPTMPPFEYSWKGDESSGILFATTNLQNNGGSNYRYLFVSFNSASPNKNNGIVRYKIGSDGIVYNGFIPYMDQNVAGGSRAEMEIVQLPNGNFRIACPYAASGIHNGKEVITAIYTAELDPFGNVYAGNEKTLYFYKSMNNQANPYLHGLEFSPDGDKLYFTHNISQSHPSPFEYYDFNVPNLSDPNGNDIYSLNIGSSTIDESDFQYSQIELAVDGTFYLGAEERLASFSNPNNPNTANFNDNVIIISGYFANYGVSLSTTNKLLKSYTLPDQIDGMNYQQFAPTVYNATTYTAQSSGTWKLGNTNNPWNITSGDVYIEDKLIIPSGKSITIENMTFHFAPDAKIIIEPGAKLTIDGATLTNSRPCNNEEFYWQGIEVWGTSNQHQYPANNSTYQGMLILKNGGIIENAHTAAVNWKQDDWSKIGGIIQSTDGVFKNNRRDVAFMSYSNFLASNPSVKVPNLSFFRNTDFVSDNSFIEKGYGVQKHVTLWEVSGVKFINCHFSNTITTNKSNSTAPNGAIYSLNAGFRVLAGCSTSPPFGQACPTSNLLKSSFSGLSKAVEIAGTSTTEAVTIQQSEFINNIHGISVDEFDNVSINRNEIEIGNAGYAFSWPNLFIGYGINLDNSTGYIIEENHIFTNATSGYHFGINVTNGGEDDHQLYKNKLENLAIGTTAYGINHNVNYQKGLQFLCNEYLNNATAISIHSSPTTDGVRLYQGNSNPKKASGNTFINNSNDIKNFANTIIYYYLGSNSLPVNYSPSVEPLPATIVNSCPTNFGTGVIMRPLALLKEDLDHLNDEYTDLNFTYTSLIDGGNTEQFKNNIEINWSDDAWHLREKLIEKSPYLSPEALLKAAEQNILPNGMLLEVLLANPDATRGESFIEKLRSETNNTFPEYMLDFVRNNWDTQTLRSNLEGQMATIHSELSKTRNYIKYLEKSEVEYTLEERLTTMKIGNSISHKIGLMDFYIENNQFTKADSVYQATLTDPSMKNDLNLISDYADYLSFRSNLSGRNLAQLDSSEIASLQNLAENAGRVGGYAKNVLCFFYDICFEKEFPTENLVAKSMSTSANSPELEDILYNITLYPNPSDEFASIKWEIYDQIQNASYKVFDLNGLEVMSNIIDSNKGEKVIDTRSLKSGVYIIGIYNNDKIKINKKLVVNPKK